MLRLILRIIRRHIYRATELLLPLVTSRSYLGFLLFYIKGPGIVDRIRFLSPQKIYEESLCQMIVSDLSGRDKPVFLDIGANLGLISLYVLNKLPDSLIYAFEPGLQQRSLLGLTITQNKLETKLRLFPYAVSDQEALTTFVTYDQATDGAGDGLVATGRVPHRTRAIPTETITLDNFLARYKIEKVDVIKIDIEGAELLAFMGALQTLTKFRPIIYFELNPLNLKNYQHTPEATISFLTKLNYSVSDLEGTICTTSNLKALMSKDDVFVARPK